MLNTYIFGAHVKILNFFLILLIL